MEITMIVKKLIEKGAEIYDISADLLEMRMCNKVKIFIDIDNETIAIIKDQIELQYPFSLLTEQTLSKLLEFVEE